MTYAAWTAQEEAIMREKYRKIGPKKLSEILYRSDTSISRKAYQMGLSRTTPKWTADELRLLEQHAGDPFTKQLARLFSNRSPHAVESKLKKLKRSQNERT